MKKVILTLVVIFLVGCAAWLLLAFGLKQIVEFLRNSIYFIILPKK